MVGMFIVVWHLFIDPASELAILVRECSSMFEPLLMVLVAQAEEAVELRQGEDGSVLVPSSDLKRLGDEAFAAGQFERALEYYNSAAAFAKLDNLLVYAELYRMRSLSHAHLARWPEALDDAERALSLRPIWLPAAMAKAQVKAVHSLPSCFQCFPLKKSR